MTPTRRIQLLSLLFLLGPALAFDSDFSFYPQKAQRCLNAASRLSRCSGADARALNVCLCGNGGRFITWAAHCLGRQVNKAVIQLTYSTMSEACAQSRTPMTVSQQEFFDSAAGDSTTTSSATPTSSATEAATEAATSSTTEAATSSTTEATTGAATETATATATGTGTANGTAIGTAIGTAAGTATATDPAADTNNNKPGGGLSKGTVIGIAVGAAAVGVLGTLVLVMVYVRRRRQQTEMESHPMLGQSDYYHNTPSTFPPSEPSPGFGHYAADQKYAWGTSPPPGLHSPQKGPAAQFGAPCAVPHHQSSHEITGMMTGHQSETHGNAGQAYELDGSSAPAPAPAHLAVEMEGSQPPGHSGIY